ncbi:hypothetical protein C2E23DRAFT_194910 [Lenzites betulinus]|nr:hypothetical protein C2E23DRAFT_194910 [Lenzites betulinus]
MMMHHALSVTDIVNEIFDWFADGTFSVAFPSDLSGETGRRATLASSARVCKVFHEAAIRVLWSRMLDGIYPVLHLFPLFRQDPRSNEYLLEDVQENEWDRVLHYTVHVRSLFTSHHPSNPGYKKINPASYSVIRPFSERQPIFPNLYSISWDMELSEPEAILYLLSPSAEMITIRCDETTSQNPDAKTRDEWALALAKLTKVFCERNRNLTDLAFHLEDLSPSSVVSSLQPLNALIEFKIRSSQSVDLAHIHTLLSMPMLENLWLPSLAGVFNPALQDPSDGSGILSELVLERYDPSAEIFICHTLKTLAAGTYRYNNDFLFRQTCAAWAHAFPNLQELSVELTAEILQDVEPRAALAPMIAPLFGLRALTRLTVHYSTYLPINVQDADVAAIAAALPDLTLLSLLEVSLGGDFPSCTVGLRGLLAVARACPNLDTLVLRRIVFKSEDVADLPEGSLDHGLRALGVQFGVTEEALRVIVDRLFPRLEQKPEIDTTEQV